MRSEHKLSTDSVLITLKVWEAHYCRSLRNVSRILRKEGMWIAQGWGGGPFSNMLLGAVIIWSLVRILSKPLGMKLLAPGLGVRKPELIPCDWVCYVTHGDVCEVTLLKTLQ